MFEVNRENTAVLVTDPQNDFLSPEGATWSMVGESVTENKTVENIESLFKAAKENGILVFISPHYYYPTDHGWKFEGTLEKVMHDINLFDRKGPLNVDGFAGSGADWLERYKPYIEDGETVVASPHKVYGPENNDLVLQLRKRGIGRVIRFCGFWRRRPKTPFAGSGADWLERYKPYIEDGETVVASPHKVYGPENNDLVLQLRKRGIGRVILGGMSANLCTEAHMRELLEQGFEVIVVKDATAAAKTPDLGDGYAAAVTNFGFMANAVVTTEDAIAAMNAA